jgi:glucokinase
MSSARALLLANRRPQAFKVLCVKTRFANALQIQSRAHDLRKNTWFRPQNRKRHKVLLLPHKIMSFGNDLFLGIEIGGSKVQLVAADSSGTILRRQRIMVEETTNAGLIRKKIAAALAQWREINWRSAGVGFGGPVDWKSGHVHCSHQIDGWSKVDLRAWLSNLIEAPVAIDNDANVAALAEVQKGAGVGQNPVFYTNSGSGVGGGLIIDGKIYHGAAPGEAEFGHLRLAPTGPAVELECSGWAVDRKVREHCANFPTGVLAGLVSRAPGKEARHLNAAMVAGDLAAKEILDGTARTLAFALSHVVHLFHPETIILGGGLSLIGEPWRKSVAKFLPEFLMQAFLPGPAVRLAALGEDIVPIGALLLAASLEGGDPCGYLSGLTSETQKL